MAEIYVEHMLRVFGKHAKRAADEALEPLGLRTQEYDTLETIARYMSNPDIPELTISSIARRLGVLIPSASDYTGWLVRAGYVRATAGGGRLLTTEGEVMLEECRHELRHVNQQMSELFQAHELGALAKAFLKLQEQEGLR